MDLDFCFIDITKLKVTDSSNFKDYILFSKSQKNYFEKCLADIILTAFYVYQDTIKMNSNTNRLFQLQINHDILESDIIILSTIENWNYALLIGSSKSSLNSLISFETYLKNLQKLLKFLFGTLENSFLKHKQETSIIIDKSVENYCILNLQKPFENYKNYPNLFEDFLMEFASSYNRHEKEYILISDVYLIRENYVIYSRNSDYLLELFLYHSVIKSENEGVHSKYYFHKIHFNDTNLEQRYSFFISNCFLTFIVIFNCQLKSIKSPPISLIRRSRAFIKKLGKYIKDNIPDVKLQNYQNIDEILLQIGRRENKLINWFRSRSLSFSVNEKFPEENKILIKVFGESNFASSSIYGLKYRNNLFNYRYDFPLKISTTSSWDKIDELNNLFTNIDEEMKSIANDLQMKTFEVVYFVDLSEESTSKKLYVKIIGVFDEIKSDWLVMCIKHDCLIDIDVCMSNVRQFIQT